jgi:hypothetical protein
MRAVPWTFFSPSLPPPVRSAADPEATAATTRNDAEAAIQQDTADNVESAARRRKPPGIWRIMSPLAAFATVLLIEALVILWGCDMFQPWGSRSVENELLTSVSVTYVEPYLHRLPIFYTGNLTSMHQGRVLVISFDIPRLQPCVFLDLDTDVYIQAVAEACLVPPSHVSLVEHTKCNATAGVLGVDTTSVTMWATVPAYKVSSGIYVYLCVWLEDICMCVRVCIYICVCVHIHMLIHTHTHTHTHTHRMRRKT